MKKIFILFVFLLLKVGVYGIDYNETFSKANDAYTKSKYDTAITLYKSIILAGKESAEVYFNMGNSFFKQKDYANAILYYERAHQLLPGDDDINFNLQLAQTMVVDKINSIPEFFVKRWWRIFSELFSSNTWAFLSILMFVFSLLILLVYLFAMRVWLKKLSFYIGSLFILACIVSFLNSYSIKQINTSKTGAIVMSASVTLKSSPNEGGTDLFVLHEGAKVQVIDNVGEWLKIKIADGNTGWLLKNNIEEI